MVVILNMYSEAGNGLARRTLETMRAADDTPI